MSNSVEFKTKLRKGDQVLVLSGKDKGKTGEVLSFSIAKNRVLVKGVNLVKDTKKARNAEEKSQIVTREASIHISNLAYYNQETSKPTKLGYKTEGGKKQRYMKKESKVI
ncbi:MAG: 50S ribosomal protein L24 [Rickettsiales bacterium]|jgi:large subunit ribosomal protein L24|nr:50S ribosomal protein L24 [Rickettsiales bacterium]